MTATNASTWAARRAGETDRVYSFMVRTAIPGGRLSSDQLLAELDLCDEVGNGTLRITAGRPCKSTAWRRGIWSGGCVASTRSG